MTGDEFVPTYAYPDGSGWSGTDTSRERAYAADANGTTKGRQAAVVAALGRRRYYGATWKELAEILAVDGIAVHHGSVSGALSNLHRADRVVLLEERRGRSHVYVLPKYADGRPSIAPRRNRSTTTYICARCGAEETEG
jgi:hypothetical protein